MTIRNVCVALTVAAAAGLAGCATRGEPVPLPEDIYGVDESGQTTRGEGGAGDGTGIGDQDQLRLDPLQDPDSPLAKRVIYFDYDSDQVKADSLPTVNAHAQYLANNPLQKARLEGHGDERGSREYNLALGERRAQSVRRLLQLQGVLDDQIEIISYGEELPAAPGQDARSWSLNRRVEIVYGEQ
ncbi:MAG: peptidoglycan-associated lipoprotein Pal [Gammaproteobacteria bacterium]|nr:peptidoglycan-associated lipoprotein Pal [Gammaproteobacteria bacterium]